MAHAKVEALNDLDMLFDFAKDAEIAAMSYMAAAGMAHDAKLQSVFERMATMSLDTQKRTVNLLRKLGGRV